MNNGVKIALIGAATVLIADAALTYFSPYRTCVRSIAQGDDPTFAQSYCATHSY